MSRKEKRRAFFATRDPASLGLSFRCWRSAISHASTWRVRRWRERAKRARRERSLSIGPNHKINMKTLMLRSALNLFLLQNISSPSSTPHTNKKQIELAYDKLLMNSMARRLSGEAPVEASVRYADLRVPPRRGPGSGSGSPPSLFSLSLPLSCLSPSLVSSLPPSSPLSLPPLPASLFPPSFLIASSTSRPPAPIQTTPRPASAPPAPP